jgi:uncharacterized Zn-binding protein involved in type VI secretion
LGKIAAKQGDKVVATDIHILLIPAAAGAPVPTPTPMPFNGTITSGLSTDVFIEGKPAATVNSGAINTPIHIPAGGPFQKPPSNQGKILMGSTGVFINGKPAARQGDIAVTCNDPIDAPLGQVVAVGTVFIGETGAGAPSTSPTQTKQTFLNARWGQQGTIISADWEKKTAKNTDEVKLTAKLKDYEDGTAVHFLVWEEKAEKQNVVCQIDGEVRQNKVEVKWKPSFNQTKKELEEEVEEEKDQEFYFVLSIEGTEKKSGPLKISYPIDICVEDENGNPIDGVGYTVTLADGNKKKGKFQKGHAKIDDALYGRFIVEIEGYDFVFQ